ncbi:MAG: hypothetical protein QXH92_04050 [Candidatus Aenigmatarchaeota archaeon]
MILTEKEYKFILDQLERASIENYKRLEKYANTAGTTTTNTLTATNNPASPNTPGVVKNSIAWGPFLGSAALGSLLTLIARPFVNSWSRQFAPEEHNPMYWIMLLNMLKNQ